MSRLFASALVLIFAVIQTGSALRCWKCSSDIDRHCNDPFNGTQMLERRGSMYDNNNNYNNRPPYDTNYNPSYNPAFNNLNSQTPYMEQCDENEASLRRMKNVCIKKTIRGSGYVSIIRRCQMIGFNENIGTCHDPVSRGLSLEFCEYCDYDGCNSATGLKTNVFLATLLSAVSIWFLRH